MKKRLEDIFYLFAYGVNDLSYLVVLIIFVLMTVDASWRLLLLFLAGKYALEKLFDSLSCAALDIFLVDILYL